MVWGYQLSMVSPSGTISLKKTDPLQKSSAVHSSLARGGNLEAILHCVMGCWLAWSYAGLVQAVTAPAEIMSVVVLNCSEDTLSGAFTHWAILLSHSF